MATYGDLLFGNIAVLNNVLPESVVVDCYCKMYTGTSLQQYLVANGIISKKAADQIDYAKRYYQFKDAERVYYKLVPKQGLVPQQVLQGLLEEQKRDDNRPPLLSPAQEEVPHAAAASQPGDRAGEQILTQVLKFYLWV